MIKILVASLSLTPCSQAAFALLESGSGTFTLGDGSGVTYSISGTNAPFTDLGGGNLRARNGAGTSATITFSSAVNLRLLPFTVTNQGFTNFDADSNAAVIPNTFSADTGAWTIIDNPGGPTVSSTGSDLTFSLISPGLNPGNNWGSAEISGITSITWTIPDTSNLEGFNFSAEGAVPEPSGITLLALGAAGVLLRRQRKNK